MTAVPAVEGGEVDPAKIEVGMVWYAIFVDFNENVIILYCLRKPKKAIHTQMYLVFYRIWYYHIP